MKLILGSWLHFKVVITYHFQINVWIIKYLFNIVFCHASANANQLLGYQLLKYYIFNQIKVNELRNILWYRDLKCYEISNIFFKHFSLVKSEWYNQSLAAILYKLVNDITPLIYSKDNFSQCSKIFITVIGKPFRAVCLFM